MFRNLIALALLVSAASAEPIAVTVQTDAPGTTISRHLYGQFAEHLGRCVYDGLWVGPESTIPNTRGMRTDIVEALRKIHIPNLRWPGGCFADNYHWRDGVGPREQRPKRINMHWGGVVDQNSFGTHEFLDLCELIGAEPYIAGNVGSGTPQELRDWVEYMTFAGDSEIANLRRKNGREEPWKVPFLGVGNENWGCGGNMRPEYYADLFRRYSTFCPDYSGNKLTRVACGPGGYDQNWTKVVMDRAHSRMQALSVHFYTVLPEWENKWAATGFDEAQWFGILKESLNLERAINETEEEMDRVDPKKRIGMFVDEWGTWYRVEQGAPDSGLYQQNSIRDAIVAAQSFHILQEHADRVRMANIAQVVNVLQAMILTEGERMLLTPTYHVFDLYQPHQDATYLPVKFTSPEYKFADKSMPAVSIGASRDKADKIHVSLSNADPKAIHEVMITIPGLESGQVSGRLLTAETLDAHNTFAEPENVKPEPFTTAKFLAGQLSVTLPPRSVLMLEVAN